MYVIVVHMIEKYHSEMHHTEEIYTICIDIHCIKGISMYLLNMSFHMSGKISEATSKNDNVFEILIFIAVIMALLMSFLMLFYIMIGMIITLLLPCLLGLLLSFLGGIGMIIGFIGGIVVCCIIWAKSSDKIYSWLLDVEIFKIPKKILSLQQFHFRLIISVFRKPMVNIFSSMRSEKTYMQVFRLVTQLLT